MLMFELVEAVRSRLIGPKYWDRIVILFGAIFEAHGLCGLLCRDLCIKSCCDVCGAGIGQEIRVHQVNR